MDDNADTTHETNSQTTENQSEQTGDVQAPASSDTNSSTTENQPEPKQGETLLTPPADASTDEDTRTDEQKAADTAAEEAKAALFGAPEGDYTITLPEGMTLDTEALAAITPAAKELGLSDAGLNKLVSTYAETILPKLGEQYAASINSQVQQLRTDWATDARAAVEGGKNSAGEDVTADPIFGGEKMAGVQSVAAKALDRFGGEGFREFLNEHGLGNHPQMVRFAYAAGIAISEDTSLPRGQGGNVAPVSREEKYYGKTS